MIAPIAPSATCGRHSVFLVITGDNLSDATTVIFERTDDRGNTHGAFPVRAFDRETLIVPIRSDAGAPPQGDPPVVYDVIVRNPDGAEARLPAALTKFGEQPYVGAVTPNRAATDTQVEITVTGALYGRLAVQLGAEPRGNVLVTTDAVDHRVTGSLSLGGVPRGSYAIVVRDQAGCTGALDNAFTVE